MIPQPTQADLERSPRKDYGSKCCDTDAWIRRAEDLRQRAEDLTAEVAHQRKIIAADVDQVVLWNRAINDSNARLEAAEARIAEEVY